MPNACNETRGRQELSCVQHSFVPPASHVAPGTLIDATNGAICSLQGQAVTEQRCNVRYAARRAPSKHICLRIMWHAR